MTTVPASGSDPVAAAEMKRPARDPAHSAALLSAAERIMGLGSFELDLRSAEMVRSAGWMRILGRSLEELAEHPHWLPDTLHPDDRVRWRQAVEAARDHGLTFDAELRVQRPDGEIRIVRMVGEPVPGPDGRPATLVGLVLDVTAERRAEQGRADAWRLLEAIAGNTDAVIAVKDTEGRILFSNKAHAKVFGRDDPAELIGVSVRDLVPAEKAEAVLALESRVMAEDSACVREETLERTPGEVTNWLSHRFPIRDADGAPVGTGVVSMDVTGLQRALEALRFSEERFRLLAEHSTDMIFTCRMGPEPVLEYVSPAAKQVLATEPDELIGRDFHQVLEEFAPEDHQAIHEAFLTGQPIVVRIRKADGSTAYVEQQTVGIRDGTGTLVRVEGNLRDVTERVLAEQHQRLLTRQLEQAEHLEALGRLAGGVAHDFNNLLAVILGTADLLRDDLDADDPRADDVQRIAKAAQHGADLTRQMLVFSRRRPSQAGDLDVNEAITSIESMVRRTIGEDIDFSCDLQPGLPMVTIDRAKFEQVLVNLVTNARAAMPEGGILTVRTRAVTAAGEPGLSPGGRYVELTVIDTGEGMASEVAKHAFDPYFTTRGPGEGSGLGLATVQGVIKEAGGHLGLDTALGTGTTVRIHLPVTDHTVDDVTGRTVNDVTSPTADDAGASATIGHPAEDRAATPSATSGTGPGTGTGPAPDAGPSPGGGRTVLVVEDEDPVRQVVTEQLRRSGFQVIAGLSPDEALRLFDGPDASHDIDLLLTDIVMPGMSGTQLAERVRALRPGLPVIYMSGHAQSGPSETDDTTTALQKPFQTATLLDAVRTALGAPSSG